MLASWLIGVVGCGRAGCDVALNGRNALTDQLFDRRHRFVIERGDDRDRGAGAPGTAGAADPMNVIVGMMRHVEIEDMTGGGNVQTSRSDIGSHQQRNVALAELIECGGAGRLVHVAMQRADGKAVLLQRFVQQRHFAFAVAEDDRVLEVLGVAQEAPQRLALIVRLAADADLELCHARSCGRGPGDFDLLGIMQEGFGDTRDFRRHRRGEEQRLAGEGDQFADTLDIGDEAHIQHAVGFIDDQQFDAGEEETAALGMVEQPAGSCDQNVDAARQFGILIAKRYAADQKRDVEFLAGAVFVETLLHLRRELARRLQDQGARHSGAGAALFQHGEHRQNKSSGLASTGLGDAENVPAGQNVGDRLFLNGGRDGVTGGRDRGEHLVGQTEMRKRH